MHQGGSGTLKLTIRPGPFTSHFQSGLARPVRVCVSHPGCFRLRKVTHGPVSPTGVGLVETPFQYACNGGKAPGVLVQLRRRPTMYQGDGQDYLLKGPRPPRYFHHGKRPNAEAIRLNSDAACMALRQHDRVWCWVVHGLGVSCGVPELAAPMADLSY